MNGYMRTMLVLIVLGVFVLAPVSQVAQAGGEGGLRRLAANFRGFNLNEIVTGASASGTPPASGGIVIYSKSLYVPEDINVLFVTVAGTSDQHNGAQLYLTCLLDGVACNGGSLSDGAFAGWIPLQRHRNYNLSYTGAGFHGDGGGGAGDLHDNGFYYTWCTKIKTSEEEGATHNVKVKLAAFDIDASHAPLANVEAIHFFVDGAELHGSNACTEDKTMP